MTIVREETHGPSLSQPSISTCEGKEEEEEETEGDGGHQVGGVVRSSGGGGGGESPLTGRPAAAAVESATSTYFPRTPSTLSSAEPTSPSPRIKSGDERLCGRGRGCILTPTQQSCRQVQPTWNVD